MRVAVGNDFNVDVSVYVDDDLTAADSLPTLTLTDPDGDTVAHGAVASIETGVYRAKVEAQSEVSYIDVQWDITVDSYNIRQHDEIWVDGGYLFELAELRALPSIQDVVRFPVAALRVARDQVTTFINDYTLTAFVETFFEQTYDGKASNTLLTERGNPQRVLFASLDGVAEDTSEWTVARDGRVRAATTWMTTRTEGQGVVLRYTYGEKRPPADLKRAAIALAQNWLLSVESSIPDRARMMTTSWATFQLSSAGEEFPTGYPEIDSVLNRRGYRSVPSFG